MIYMTRCHEVNSHGVNSHKVNSHEVNFTRGQLSRPNPRPIALVLALRYSSSMGQWLKVDHV